MNREEIAARLASIVAEALEEEGVRKRLEVASLLSKADQIIAMGSDSGPLLQHDYEQLLVGYENMGPEGDHDRAVKHLCSLLRQVMARLPSAPLAGGG
jgi:hypothetical protein